MNRISNFKSDNNVRIIAEIGVNHEGSRKVAEDLIDQAAMAGANFVKFQTFSADKYVSSAQPERRDRVSRFQLSNDDFRILAKRAEDQGVVFFSTPLHSTDVDFLDEIAPVFKISSGDLTYVDLIEYTASKGKPVIISTGLGTREEIQSAVDAAERGQPGIGEAGRLLLMHCVAAYPTPAEEANVANVTWLRREFGLPTGYSDHTLGIQACELAVALGAVALEKHFTYRKEGQDFHDHAISANPEDLRELVSRVRQAETLLGSDQRQRGPSESKILDNMRRSVGALRDLPANTPIEKEWLVPLRPAWGVPVERINDLVGQRLNRSVTAGELIMEEDIKP